MAFHPLKVKAVEHPTEDCVEVCFEVPEELREAYAYLPGQHLTLRKEINKEDVRRSYSICACPLDGDLTVAIKKVEGGRFSTFANEELRAGDTLEVLPPSGKFSTPLDPDNEKSYVAFAGGSGITPIISIIETALRTEPKSKFTLFYTNRRSGSIIFHERLEGLKNTYMGRFSLYHILTEEMADPELYHGRIDREKLEIFARLFFDPSDVDEFFTCGPEPMMIAIRDALLEMGVSSSRIHMELFTSPLGKLGTGDKKEKPAIKAKSEVTITMDGHQFTFPYDSSDSILEVAIENGVDLPFACKGGVCSTCVCKLQEGEVEMTVNYALEPDELAKGMILSCQSHPKTDKVKLTFDI